MNAIQKLAVKVFNIKTFSVKGLNDNATPPAHYPTDWWQKGMDLTNNEVNTTVEACVKTISETVAMLPIYHYRDIGDGEKEKVTTSAASRVMRKPNPFQTRSDFFLNFVRQLLLQGNGYGAVTRNNRYEIDALYPQYNMNPHVSADNKDVYYSTDNNELVNLDSVIPSRNVLHTRLHAPVHPLIGVTPLLAASISAATATSIQGHENAFFTNMSRPSGVVSTDMTLTGDETKKLRERFNEQTKDLNTGGIPILTNGLKYQQMSMSAVDSQIIETYKMNKTDIASVFRVPLPLIGSMDNATFNNVEALMKFWVSSGLGFILDHIEGSLNELFNLPANEFLNFDTDYLLRSDFKSRMGGLKESVQGGIYTPNEARAKEGLPPKPNGNDIYLQAQMVKVGTTMDGNDQGDGTDGDEVVEGDTDNESAKDYMKRFTNEI